MMKNAYLACTALVAGMVSGHSAGAQTYEQAVQATNPEANFRLTTPTTGSTNGGYTTTYNGSVTTGPGAPIASDPGNTGALFDGVNSANPGIINTSLSGGVPGAGTILAWVNLATLPSALGHIDYVAGESQYGNDLDLQFEGDNALRFYTGGGENTAYSPLVSSLVGQWHFIAATYDSSLGTDSFRNIYWDGVLGTGYTGGVDTSSKSNPFTIGYSPVFTGREFSGAIDEVTVYNHALTADQISALYASRLYTTASAGALPEPASWAMMIVGFALLGAGLRYRRRRTVLQYA